MRVRIAIVMPPVKTWCPTRQTEAVESQPVMVILPETTAGPVDVLIV